MTTPEWSPVLAMIVPSDLAQMVRQLAGSFPGGAGMWTTPLSSTGGAPATNYVSHGRIYTQFHGLLQSPEALAAATGMTVAQTTGLLSRCVVTETPVRDVMAEQGLTIAELISINEADSDELELAPSVGKVTADKIIDGRPWASVKAMCTALGLPYSTLEHWYA
jgi:hypothetical protein